MLPATLPDSVVSKMAIAARQLLEADATLKAWSGGKIYRTRELGPANVGGEPCIGNHIVVTPGTLFAQPNPNNESQVFATLSFGIAFSEPYRAIEDGEDAPQDVAELIQKQLLTDPVFQATHGSALAERFHSFPLIDAEPQFADPTSPLGFLPFDAQWETRIDRITRALVLPP